MRKFPFILMLLLLQAKAAEAPDFPTPEGFESTQTPSDAKISFISSETKKDERPSTIFIHIIDEPYNPDFTKKSDIQTTFTEETKRLLISQGRLKVKFISTRTFSKGTEFQFEYQESKDRQRIVKNSLLFFPKDKTHSYYIDLASPNKKHSANLAALKKSLEGVLK
jgi:hypothetical protein